MLSSGFHHPETLGLRNPPIPPDLVQRMDAPRPAPTPAEAAAALPWWRIGRLSLGFVLDLIALRPPGGDVVDPLILTVVLEANIAAVNQDPELQRRYARADDPPPDELRRPVSVSAVAASLRLPYETVRRRVAKLAGLGACVVTPEGVMIPAAVVNNAAYLIFAGIRYERLKQFYFDLKALGALQNLPAPAEGPPFDAPPARIAARVISEYFLRVVDSIMLGIGDPVAGLLLLEMARANGEHAAPEERLRDGPIPDDLRRPIRPHALARRVGMPAETVRRHLAKLDETGFCRRVPGGLLAALEQLGERTADGYGLATNLVNVQRMFVKLATLGVVAYWEQEAS
jgi:DNA-binding Lrp family transcriptional regulator